jgi:Ni/Co efflux regulator RcnB
MKRQLAMAALAALFAASSSLVMLHNARPAMADQNWNRGSHLQRVDRDDRKVRHDRDHRKVRHDRDDRKHIVKNPHYRNGKPRHVAVRDNDKNHR